MRDRTVFVLFGPKGVGKTHIARLLRSILGIHHVDADPIVLDLMSKGIQPDPTYGWLEPVQRAVEEALTDHSVVAMEATGAWPTDWEIVRRLSNKGVVVRTVRVTAPKAVAAARLASRTEPRAPISKSEVEWIHDQSLTNLAGHQFDVHIDSADDLDEGRLLTEISDLIPNPTREEKP